MLTFGLTVQINGKANLTYLGDRLLASRQGLRSLEWVAAIRDLFVTIIEHYISYYDNVQSDTRQMPLPKLRLR
jgi:hypothetical protein